MRTRQRWTVSRDHPRPGERIRLGESSERGVGGGAGGSLDGARRAIPEMYDVALERLTRITVPPQLLQLGLRDYAEPAAGQSSSTLSAILLDHVVAMGLPGNPIEVAISAQLRVLALACVVRDGLLEEWVRRGDPNGIVLFHASLFVAAADEPLILFPPDGIGFNPESLRWRVLQLAEAKGSA